MGWASRLRASAGAAVLALAAVACVSSNPVVGPSSATTGAASGSEGPSGGTTATPGSPTVPDGPGSGGTLPATGPGPSRPAYDDHGPVGAMATTYLRRSPASSLVVEVDWVSGRKPSQGALDHLAAVLRRELDKPGGISVRLGNDVGAGRSTWTVSNLVALERAQRANRSSGSRATMWICYLDGSFDQNPNALGVSFMASAAVIFRDRIDDATTALVLAPEIERSVMLHEAGHLLALVNIGYRSRQDHEDPAHPNHSNDPESVMYWAVEDLSIRNLLRGGPPDDFDADDRDDLAMLREA